MGTLIIVAFVVIGILVLCSGSKNKNIKKNNSIDGVNCKGDTVEYNHNYK